MTRVNASSLRNNWMKDWTRPFQHPMRFRLCSQLPAEKRETFNSDSHRLSERPVHIRNGYARVSPRHETTVDWLVWGS
jgi:hypothetical protein